MPEQTNVPPPPPQLSVAEEFSLALDWCRRNPREILLGVSTLAILIFFYGFLPLCPHNESVAVWAWEAWNPGENQEHSKLVIPIALGLVIYHYQALKEAVKRGSGVGLIFLLGGILLYVLAARCLQPRMALLSVPFVLFGGAYYLWGRQVARIIRFPCAFLIFMVPSAVIEQATAKLQFVVTGAVGVLANLVGIQIQAVGTTLTAADGAFNFEIAEGCSGIRSLIALTMLTAVYVHLTQKEIWKKLVILAASVVFAIIGNTARIFTIILVAKFINPELAGGLYHHYSGFLFFPFALLAMLGFGKLLNMDFKKVARTAVAKESRDQVSYDY